MTKALAAVLAAEALVFAGLFTLGLDMFAHRRVEQLGGVNTWGYRGPVMHQKRPDEIRVAVVGGDLAFGWGVAASETLAPGIRQIVSVQMDQPGGPLTHVTAVNLGAMGLSVAGYPAWIAHFGYLKPDVVCIVMDPERHSGSAARWLPDRRSALFTRFGYAPILPLVLQEKGAVMHSGAVQSVGVALDRVDQMLMSRATTPSAGYAESLARTVRAADAVASAGVVVVMPPRMGSEGGDRAPRAVASGVPGQDMRVRTIHLEDDEPLNGADLRLDGFNFSAGGHARAARDVAPAVIALLQAGGRAR
jgi:hypothetical protein